MITLQECIKDMNDIGEDTLVKLSDKLWELGTLEDIKKEVTPELFTFHIGINIIGNWKCDGWWGIICEQVYLVPFISDTLKAFGLTTMKTDFDNIISCFPPNTIFEDSNDYCDTVNFLQNVRFKVENKKLNEISLENRKEMVQRVHDYLEELEDISESVWGEDSENEGWKIVIDYINNEKNKCR